MGAVKRHPNCSRYADLVDGVWTCVECGFTEARDVWVELKVMGDVLDILMATVISHVNTADYGYEANQVLNAYAAQRKTNHAN